MKITPSLAVAAALAAVVLTLVVSPIVPAWNRSESIPKGLYLATDAGADTTLVRGQLACFPYENPVWVRKPYLYRGEILCKYVMGLPGDVIKTAADGSNQVCRAGQCTNVGTALKRDSRGDTVTPPVFQGAVIPDNTYYMGSTRRPNSLDSRYLGLIPKNKIVKTLVPVLVQQDN